MSGCIALFVSLRHHLCRSSPPRAWLVICPVAWMSCYLALVASLSGFDTVAIWPWYHRYLALILVVSGFDTGAVCGVWISWGGMVVVSPSANGHL